jgi:Na+/proline symporter
VNGASEDSGTGTDGRSDPNAAFIEALAVRRNGTIGIITGILFAILWYVGFVVLPASTTFPRPLYLPLLVVVAFGVAVLVATALTAVTAWKQVRELPES